MKGIVNVKCLLFARDYSNHFTQINSFYFSQHSGRHYSYLHSITQETEAQGSSVDSFSQVPHNWYQQQDLNPASDTTVCAPNFYTLLERGRYREMEPLWICRTQICAWIKITNNSLQFGPSSASAAAAAKSLPSCPTLCDPIDGSPPGSPIPGILQARTLRWVAISFSNACTHAKALQSCPTQFCFYELPKNCPCPECLNFGLVDKNCAPTIAELVRKGWGEASVCVGGTPWKGLGIPIPWWRERGGKGDQQS